MAEVKLEPCPFCGGPASFFGNQAREGNGAVVECVRCDFGIGREEDASVIAAWNRRASGWRPKYEWRFKGENGRFVFYYPRQRADWFDGGWLGPLYEYADQPPSRAMDWTLFMRITPPEKSNG